MTTRKKFLAVKKAYDITNRLSSNNSRLWYVDGKRSNRVRVSRILQNYGLTVAEFLTERQADYISDKHNREVKPCDDSDDVFNLLPELDELNDDDDELVDHEISFEELLSAKIAAFEAAQPAEVKELNAQLAKSKLQSPTLWVKIFDGCGNFYRGAFGRGVLSAVRVEYHAEPEAIKGYTVRYYDEPMAVYDTLEQVKVAIEQFKAAITNNADSFTFPAIEELNTPPTDIAKYQAVFDKARKDSIANDMKLKCLDINGETIYFRDGELTAIDAKHYQSKIIFDRDGRKRFYYRGIVEERADMLEYFSNGVIADEQKEIFAEFYADYQSRYDGYFELKIRPAFANGSGGLFFTTADDFNHALEVIELFKTLDLPFIGTIKRNVPFGEEYYQHHLDGSEVINPPQPKLPANIKDSLQKAMKIALEQHRRYNLNHNQTAANRERECFMICKKALKAVA